jgi:KUP system potassium uptake protein
MPTTTETVRLIDDSVLLLVERSKWCVGMVCDDRRGDIAGGTFALYSLISRHAKIRLIPDQQDEDAAVSNYCIQAPNSGMKRAQWIKERLESSNVVKIVLFFITILGTSMVMGDGTLTPAISGTYTFCFNHNRLSLLDVKHVKTIIDCY